MKPFTTIGAVVFALVAVAHLLRLIFSWAIIIDTLTVPYWVSIVGLLIAAILSIMLFREARR
jgi:hypothetical protein